MTLGILGGTGHEGGGLARRWAKAGHKIILGSRDAAKAAKAASVISRSIPTSDVSGATNREAAEKADVVVLTVPFGAQKQSLQEVREALSGKIVVDATAPLVPPKVGTVQLPPAGSAVAEMQAMLGPEVRVVSAFQNVSAHHLADLDHVMDCDVLICGNDESAREVVVGLANDAGARGIHAGPIANSAAAEALTSILITINRRYKVSGAGIRLTGLPGQAAENA
jgi:8-hydroxy-5-deazaflavin:NADPH oxidoreductase